jgi:hypothetical protein
MVFHLLDLHKRFISQTGCNTRISNASLKPLLAQAKL